MKLNQSKNFWLYGDRYASVCNPYSKSNCFCHLASDIRKEVEELCKEKIDDKDEKICT